MIRYFDFEVCIECIRFSEIFKQIFLLEFKSDKIVTFLSSRNILFEESWPYLVLSLTQNCKKCFLFPCMFDLAEVNTIGT